jgi:hypothetical protein
VVTHAYSTCIHSPLQLTRHCTVSTRLSLPRTCHSH